MIDYKDREIYRESYDLLHYRRKDDLGAFQLVARDVAAALLIALGALLLLFWPEAERFL